MVLVNCLQCGKEFNIKPSRITKGGGKYCSNECKHKSQIGLKRSKEYIKHCLQCGNEFKVTLSNKTKKYCSKICVHKSMIGKCTEKQLESLKIGWEYQKNQERFKKICIRCGKEFYVDKSRINTAKYCSRSCKHNSQFKKCLYCGIEFKVRQYTLKNGHGKFCSRTCYHTYCTGENSHMYNRIVTEETRNKIKDWHIGRELSDDTKEKISKSKFCT
jgi:hypothetical protein